MYQNKNRNTENGGESDSERLGDFFNRTFGRRIGNSSFGWFVLLLWLLGFLTYVLIKGGKSARLHGDWGLKKDSGAPGMAGNTQDNVREDKGEEYRFRSNPNC